MEDPDVKSKRIQDVMEDPIPFVASDNTLDVLSSLMNTQQPAVLVRDENDNVHIITQQDILLEMTH